MWLSVAWHRSGVVNLDSVVGSYRALPGCGTGIGVGLVLSALSVLFFPREFAWEKIPEILEQQHKEQVERTAKHHHTTDTAGETSPNEKPSSINSTDPRLQLEIIENDPLLQQSAS